jgi:tetratricopeptide (TPR) repeat protein
MQVRKYLQPDSKRIFILILTLQLIYMLAASLGAGISADEFRHNEQARKVFNYYSTLGKDKSALGSTRQDPMQYNGQSFDNLMYLAGKIFKVDNYMEMRHFFNALIGWLIILVTGLIVKEIIGYRGAIFAILVLFLSPRFIGHALNNNKDIPFALGFILSILGILLFLKELPKPRRKTLILLAAGIAFSISTRIAGLLTIGFLVLFSLIYYLFTKPGAVPVSKNKVNLLKKLIISLVTVSFIGFFVGILFWPFLLENPIKNLKEVINATNYHPLALNQLFEGKIYLSNSLPWYYTLKYMAITYPVIIFAGIVLFIFLWYKFRKQYQFIPILLIIVPFLFVVFWMTIKNSNVYGEIRHILFIYPLAVILCTLGFDMLGKLMVTKKSRLTSYTFYGILLLLVIHPVSHLVRNYPYAYIYFNELSGGINKNWTDYETDYFQHSLKPATQWLIRNELGKTAKSDTAKIRIVTNDASNVGYYLRKVHEKVSVEYTRYYEKASKNWDYAIFYSSYISPLQLKNKLWPPSGTIHTEKVGDAVIAAVVKRPTNEDYLGFYCLEKQQPDSALVHFSNVLKDQPENEEVLAGISRIYVLKNDLKKAIEFADRSLKYTPDLITSVYYKTIALNNSKDYKGAMAMAQKMIKLKNDLAEGYYQKGIAFYGLGYPNDAIKELQQAINMKKEYSEAYMFLGHILMNRKQYAQAIDAGFSKILKYRSNDFLPQIKIAQCQYFLKNTGRAEEMLKQFRTTNPTHFEVIKLATRLSLDKNNFQEAYNFLMMLREVRNNSDLDLVRALFLLKVNDPESAKKSAESAINIDKNNLEAVELLQTFNHPASTESVMKQQNTTAKRPPVLR